MLRKLRLREKNGVLIKERVITLITCTREPYELFTKITHISLIY